MDIDFKKKLKEQLDFLETSCNLYDSGKLHEAIRIAGILRTVFNDEKYESLLNHLKSKNIILLSTAYETSGFSSLIRFEISLNGVKPRSLPFLNDSKSRRYIPFIDWWEKEIILRTGTDEITRKKLILITANTDGSAHIGKKLPCFFEAAVSIELTHEGYTTTIKSDDADAVWAVLRQIGYEVLNSQHLKKLTI